MFKGHYTVTQFSGDPAEIEKCEKTLNVDHTDYKGRSTYVGSILYNVKRGGWICPIIISSDSVGPMELGERFSPNTYVNMLIDMVDGKHASQFRQIVWKMGE